jgi:hypothetical protein
MWSGSRRIAMPLPTSRSEACGETIFSLRIVGFERRISIAFLIGGDFVTFLRILYGGRDLESLHFGEG